MRGYQNIIVVFDKDSGKLTNESCVGTSRKTKKCHQFVDLSKTHSVSYNDISILFHNFALARGFQVYGIFSVKCISGIIISVFILSILYTYIFIIVSIMRDTINCCFHACLLNSLSSLMYTFCIITIKYFSILPLYLNI